MQDYFSKCCNFANLVSKTYLLSSADTAVQLSFSILYSTDPSITMGSTSRRAFLTSYTGSMIWLVVTVLDLINTLVNFWRFTAYSSKGNSPIVKAIPSSMVMSLSLAEKQSGWEYLISNILKSNRPEHPHSLTYRGARSQDGNESGSRFHDQWNKDTLGNH